MPLDPSIILQGRAPQIANPMDVAQQAMSLRQMQMQNQAQEQQSQEQRTMRELLKKNTVQGPDGSVSLDRKGTLRDMMQVDPQKAIDYQKMFEGQDLEQLKSHTQAAKTLAWSATPENYPQIRAKAIEMGLPNADKIPEMYSPNFVQRWQMGTLDGEKQLAHQMQQQEIASRAADRAESRASRAHEAAGKRAEKNERNIEQDMQKLAKDVAGTQQMVGALDEVEGILGSKIEEFSVKDGNLMKGDKSVDLPGVSVPGVGRVTAYSTQARDLNSAASRVFNATLKDRSGGAVTDNEMERLRREFNEGKFNTEPELIAALQRYKRQTTEVLKNREAGYTPEVVGRYTDQGGRTSKTIQSAPQGAQPKTISQNGYTYTLNPETGEYE